MQRTGLWIRGILASIFDFVARFVGFSDHAAILGHFKASREGDST